MKTLQIVYVHVYRKKYKCNKAYEQNFSIVYLESTKYNKINIPVQKHETTEYCLKTI